MGGRREFEIRKLKKWEVGRLGSWEVGRLGSWEDVQFVFALSEYDANKVEGWSSK